MQGARIGGGFLRAAQVRLGHDLEQRRPGAVEVDAGHAVKHLVQRLPRVFLEVGAGDSYLPRNLDVSALNDWNFVLADLVALGQIGVEVVLAFEDRAAVDGSFTARPKRIACSTATRLRTGSTRKRDIDRGSLRVRRRAERARRRSCSG